MSSPYRIASPFLIRLAGVPFDVLDELATPNVCLLARHLLTQETELEQLKKAALEFVTQRASGLTSEQFVAWRAAIRNSEIPKQKIPQQLEQYARVATSAKQTRLQLDQQLEKDLAKGRLALLETSRRILPRYLVFGSGEVHHLIDHSGEKVPIRNSRVRERERHLLLYLQRIAAKNDTFSEFGPSAWGSAHSREPVFSFEARPGIARREVFLERWTAHALAAGINADPETFSQRCPRLNPSGVLIGHLFIFVDSGETVDLTSAELEIVTRCDGVTPVHERARQSLIVASRGESSRDGPPFFALASTGRSIPRTGIQTLCRRSPSRRESCGSTVSGFSLGLEGRASARPRTSGSSSLHGEILIRVLRNPAAVSRSRTCR